jgi:hypothetical protein
MMSFLQYPVLRPLWGRGYCGYKNLEARIMGPSWRLSTHTYYPLRLCPCPLLFDFSFIFWWYWGLNSGPTHWATPPALFLVMGFLREGLTNYLPGAGFEPWSSWSLPPEWLGLQVWVTGAWQKVVSNRLNHQQTGSLVQCCSVRSGMTWDTS